MLISKEFLMVAHLTYDYQELSFEEEGYIKESDGIGSDAIKRVAAQLDKKAKSVQATLALIQRDDGKYVWKSAHLAKTGNSPRQAENPFLLRGRNVYYNERDKIQEYKKAAKMALGIPFYTLVAKILIPIFVYLPLLGLSSLFGRCQWLKQAVDGVKKRFHCEWMWSRTVTLGDFTIPLPVPVRAVVGFVAHLIIGMLAMIPGLVNYFSKINGDIERWVNGHTDEDVQTKSAAARNHEIEYKTLCQQPLFQIGEKTEIQKSLQEGGTNIDFVWIHKLQPEIQRVALRTLHTGNWESTIPVERRASNRGEDDGLYYEEMKKIEVISETDDETLLVEVQLN